MFKRATKVFLAEFIDLNSQSQIKQSLQKLVMEGQPLSKGAHQHKR